MMRLYNKTNDSKRVIREFANADGQLLFTWAVVDAVVKQKLEIEGSAVHFQRKSEVRRWDPTPAEYERFDTTLWDVPRRGNWGVHQPTYRGNWAPQIPRALIELYSKPGDRVLDPFVGGGTTLLEAWALGRNATGFDVSDFALQMTRSRLHEMEKANRESLFGLPPVDIEIKRGDARRLPGVKASSIDLICAHPPYGDAVKYSHSEKKDLSLIRDPNDFMKEFGVAVERFINVLKPGGVCAVLIGDVRREGQLTTFGFSTIELFKAVGFLIDDIVIKTQNQDRTAEFWFKSENLKMRLKHEYLFVFRKPDGSGLKDCKTWRQPK